MEIIAVCFIIAINICGFVTCKIDKEKARKHEWRIPEKRFFLISICGGSVGTYLGMLHFRHKTKHKSFVIGIPMIFILQVVLLYSILLIF